MNNALSSFHEFSSLRAAEDAVLSLAGVGLDIKLISVLGRGYGPTERLMGFYTVGDRIKRWGGTGALWGGNSGLVFAPAVFLLPGLGIVTMGGPLVVALIRSLEAGAPSPGTSVLVSALCQVGIAPALALRCEAALMTEHYVMVVHGHAAHQAQVRTALETADAVHWS
ncbi:DUF1269 domain-containing protein [Pelomonas sp. APW6]|uniref:DUF1269 domain-containing protein n=1 Tax=Roseateles subflavus TaxID=3053353 RepID=A0ABT7LEG3_9BURK|nr:DUF1269 domain-containing protein [Pelomonas sp. APW6]MDL5031247.1 DUF1269 domain-containing protein [Pelomonas sp. APW6]